MAYLTTPGAQFQPIPLEQHIKISPGPGHYDPNHAIVFEQLPQYHIGGSSNRLEAVSRDMKANPGPGYYEMKASLDGHTYTIGEKHHPHPDNGFPGPGTYDPRDTITKLNSPGKTISGSERGGFDLLANPGPGHYDPLIALTGLRSSLAKINPIPVFEGGEKETPGPGHYDPEHQAISARAPTTRVARSKRDFLTVDISLPGPGQYDALQPGNSLSFTIGEKLRDNVKGSMVGPGSYAATHSQTDTRSPQHDFARSPERLMTVSRTENGLLGPGSYDAKD